jgi:hypothetical protein
MKFPWRDSVDKARSELARAEDDLTAHDAKLELVRVGENSAAFLQACADARAKEAAVSGLRSRLEALERKARGELKVKLEGERDLAADAITEAFATRLAIAADIDKTFARVGTLLRQLGDHRVDAREHWKSAPEWAPYTPSAPQLQIADLGREKVADRVKRESETFVAAVRSCRVLPRGDDEPPPEPFNIRVWREMGALTEQEIAIYG